MQYAASKTRPGPRLPRVGAPVPREIFGRRKIIHQVIKQVGGQDAAEVSVALPRLPADGRGADGADD
jgi:hypothetical protein